MELLDMIPQFGIARYAWLGRQKGWLKFVTADFDGLPGTNLHVTTAPLRAAPGADKFGQIIDNIEAMVARRNFMSVVYTEMLAAYFATGPKRFVPTEEQWESMENVEINIPISDFTSPYPVLEIAIPVACRFRLAERLGLSGAEAPRTVLVRWRTEPDENPVLVIQAGDPTQGREVCYVFQDQPGNETVETALSRNADSFNGKADRPPDGARSNTLAFNSPLFEFGHVACRAALNLCLMLAHFGCSVDAPPGKPLTGKAERGRLNRARKAHLLRGDVRTVTMNQVVVVRPDPTDNPQGPGTGIEQPPRWRRGHWRAYPGQAKLRAEGKKPMLLFIRPYLTRKDRIVGDLCESQATYHGV